MDCPHCRWSCCLHSRSSMDAPYSCSTQVNTNTSIDAMAWLGQVETFDMTAKIADNHDVTLAVDQT